MTHTSPDVARDASKLVDQPADEIDLGKLIGVLWRSRILISFCGLLTLMVGAYYALFAATPVFTANATVALESRQDQIVDIESVVSGLPGDQVAINTELEVLRSRRLIGKVAADLDLRNDPEFNLLLQSSSWLSIDSFVDWVQQDLLGQDAETKVWSDQSINDAVVDAVLRAVNVTNVRQSYVFSISVFSQDAEKSAQIANRLAELYIDDQIAQKFEKTVQATEWLTDRVAELQLELETAENQLKDFSSNTDLTSPQGLIALNRQLKDLRDRRAGLESDRNDAAARLNALQNASASSDVAEMVRLAGSAELSRLVSSEDSSEPSDRFRETYGAIVARADVEKSRLEAQLDAVEKSIGEISQRIETQSDELVQLQQLQREAEASRLIYEFFLGRLKETSVQQGLQQAESRVLSYAVVPVSASAPRKQIILMLSLTFGLLIGSAIALLREFSQNTFRVAEDLEAKTGYAVIGQIPVIPSRSRKKVLTYLRNKPNSAAAEAIRNLRTSLLLANLDKPPKIIMSTSSIPGEGKTTQSIALAQNLAGLNKKVLLIEGDIRRRVMNEYFDIPDKSGFLSVMLGEVALDQALTHLPDIGIDVLLGETSQANAADIFSSDRFAEFLSVLRESYDYIIIDTPPVLVVTDARIIGRWVDTTIYTVKWDSTSHRQVLDGLKSLEQVNIKVAGLVLGQISARGMKRYGYGDRYGAYHSYYQ